MASEYLKKKYRDVKPDAPIVLTKAQKRRNWWYYHKWFVAAGGAVLLILGSIAWNALRQVQPDYQVAYVGEHPLPEDTAAALEAELSALGEDLNGDGRVAVRLVQYASSSETDPGAAASAEVRLMADIVECESYFFLLEDPERFQQTYHALCRLDGTLPAEGDLSGEGTSLAWSQCPVLSGIDLGQYAYSLMGRTATGDSGQLVSGLFIARRGFRTEKTVPYPQGCDALWEKITEGAIS